MTTRPSAATTEIHRPRRRIFLPQTIAERVLGFWWAVVRGLLFRWSPPPLNRWRIALLRLFGAKVHSSAFIPPSVRIEYPWNLVVDRDVIMAHCIILNCMGKIEIGAGTWISQYAHLCAGTHAYRRRDMKIVRSPITIGKGVWIAADAFVGPGVTIGDGSLLAARSGAFSDLPAGQVCMGEPARPYRPWSGLGRPQGGRGGLPAPA